MRSSSYPAKISSPQLQPGILKRTRLFKILDGSRRHAVTWIASPPGAGKTTLISSYLEQRKLNGLWYQLDAGDADPASFFHYLGLAAKKAAPRIKRPLPHLSPEYLAGLSVFTKRYFEQLYQRLKPPALVVFDNYQDVPHDAPLHQIVCDALSVLPEGIKAIVLSRHEPPPAFARLRASGSLIVIGWEELKLTAQESKGIARLRIPRLSKPLSSRIHDQTQGWVAGLVLVLERGRNLTNDSALSAPQAIFDYLATEIFERMEATTQQILLQCAFLPEVRFSQAEQLTKIPNAGHVLADLSARGYFTLKHSDAGYQFHPLFREFLLARAKSHLDSAQHSSIKRSAAALLREAGRFEDAMALFADEAEWDEMISLILQEAPTLTAQGRSKTLENWLLIIPDEIRSSSPGLLYWLGSCRLAFDPRESRLLLEKAFALFKAGNDTTGALLSWSSIIDTFNYEWSDFHPLDHWIAVCEELLSTHPQALIPEVEVRIAAGMLTAMTYRQPTRIDIEQWANRIHDIILRSQDTSLQMALGNQLIFHYLWAGDISKISVIIDALRPSSGLKGYDPLTKQNWYVMQAMYSWFAADWETCQRSISDGLKNAEESGIHLLDLYLLAQGVYGGLSLGAPSVADSCLEQMSHINSPRLGDRALYQFQASSVAWYHGDFKKSITHGKQAVKITEEMGWVAANVLCLTDLSVTLFDSGEYDEADACLARAVKVGHDKVGVWLTSMTGAAFALYRGDERRGLALLKQGIELGARYGVKNTPRWNDAKMARLFAKALEHDIEPEYVKNLIKLRQLLPEKDMAGADYWPWPIRVYMLGRFQLVKEGLPTSVSENEQQKPLDLLKVLAAFGGTDVAEEKITDVLWPDADGDRARHSLKFTLHRLRKLLGSDEIIKVKNGLLSLDYRRVWVDTWHLEHMLDSLDAALRRQQHETAVTLVHKVTALNRGALLEAESASWVFAARERLLSKVLQLVAKTGERLAEYAPEALIPLYEKALEYDPLAEHLYQGLMRNYHALGRNAEGLAVYRRCHDVLTRELDHPPSHSTEALRQELQRR